MTGKYFLLDWFHPLYCSCYKPGDKSYMRKGQTCDCYKGNYPSHL